MTTQIEIDQNAEFWGDAGGITGDAHYEIDYRNGQWACELMSVKVDGLSLTRDQIAMVCTKAGVERGEEIMLERHQPSRRDTAA